MNFILLKNKHDFVKSDCEETLFSNLNLDDSKFYDPRSSLDGVKWFFIEGVSAKEYFNEILKETDSVAYPLVDASTFKGCSMILEFQEGYVAMQNITPSKYFKKRTLRSSGLVEKEEGKIILDDIPSAVYNQNTDRIYFKDLSKVKIMPDIIMEYREATQEEVDSFANSHGIVFTGNYSSDSVKTRNRQLLSLVSDKM